MRIRPFATVIAFFNKFLCIVPSAARIIEHRRQSKTARKTARQKSEHTGHTHKESHQYRNYYGDNRRQNHFALRTRRRDFHTASIIRFARPFHDSRNFAELATDFFNHRTCSTTNRLDSKRTEHERHHRTDKEAAQQHGIHQIEIVDMHKVSIVYFICHHTNKVPVLGNCTCTVIKELDTCRSCKRMDQVIHAIRKDNRADFPHALSRRSQMSEPNFHLFHIRSKERHGSQCGRTNCKALARRCSRIPEHVEFVSAFPDFRIKACHLGVSARIVCNRAKRICRKSDTERTEHTHRGKAHAIKSHAHIFKATGTAKSSYDTDDNRHHRKPRRKHANRDAIDNRRRSAQFRLPRNATRRLVGIGRIIFSELSDENARSKSRKHGTENTQRNKVKFHEYKESHKNKHRRAQRSRQKGTQKRLRVRIFTRTNRKNSRNRKDNSDRRDDHRRNHEFHPAKRECRTEGRRRKNRTAIRFIKVSTHARHIANVIADVIRNRRRVARIVFRDSRLDFTHKVGTDISRLRINAPAHAGEQSLQRRTHAKGKHRRRNFHHFRMRPFGVIHHIHIP